MNDSAQAAPASRSSLLLSPERLRAAFAAEAVDHRSLWLLASEGLAAWLRFVDRDLGGHLDDRRRARILLGDAFAALIRRRAAALPEGLAAELDDGDPQALRALFEALYPGMVARSTRWALDALAPPPGAAARLRAWRRLRALGAEGRWLEVSCHLGELVIVLSELLPARGVPRAVAWLGDACHAFGVEVGELAASIFDLPPTPESAVETLRMGELLFRVNPEHVSGADAGAGTGYIEGNACLWYERPGWGPIHCGILGRFQAGVSEVFGLRYTFGHTIPKNGGSSCRITLHPLADAPRGIPAEPHPSRPAWDPPRRLTSSAEREAQLKARVGERDPAQGFFGPASLVWTVTGETAVLLGGGRAALMQLAHPAVAHAVRDHSVVRSDKLGRLIRTMVSAYGALFGDVDEALTISERVYRMHAALSGVADDVPGQPPHPYRALDAEATFWVGATLIDTTLHFYEQLIRPLTPAERDRVVRESAPFWGLFGVPMGACPTTFAQLRGYVEARSQSLAPLVGGSARREAALLFEPPTPLLGPALEQVRLVVAFTLPAPLRGAFGMELDPQQRMRARTWLFAAEALMPRLPARLRFVPAYRAAQRRVGM